VRQGPPARPTWYIPPGWDIWRALRDENYYNYTIVDETGGETAHGNAPEDYSTDVLRDHALAFLRDAVAAHRRFLLYFAPYAPHVAWPELDPLPAPRHVGLLLDTPPLRPPSFMEAISDAPPEDYLWWLGPLFLDPDRVKRLESLLAVDEAVAALPLSAGICTRGSAYRDRVHVRQRISPRRAQSVWEAAAVRGSASRATHRLGPPTRQGSADGPAPDPHRGHRADDRRTCAREAAGDRRPVVEAVTSEPLRSVADELPARGLEQRERASCYRGARTTRWAYDERANDGAEELYDLTTDPYELQNLSGDSAAGILLDRMRSLTSSLHAGE
jgi:hypothetical protein